MTFLKQSKKHDPMANDYYNVVAKIYCLEVSRSGKSGVIWGNLLKLQVWNSSIAETLLCYGLVENWYEHVVGTKHLSG